MKRILSILALLLALTMLAACGGGNAAETPAPTGGETAAVFTVTPAGTAGTPGTTATPAETPTEAPTEASTETPIDVPVFAFDELTPAESVKKEHQVLAEVPLYATLVGSETLPPIDNQGQIGSCQSQSVTYMQLTNAVAQYMKNAGTLGDWNPSAGRDTCYSPKFTYQFCGGSTTNVYLFLQDQGALTYAEDPYVKNGDASVYEKNGVFQTDTAKWPATVEEYVKAMSIRITNYEQTYVTNNPTYTADGKKGVNMTSTEGGQIMLARIKEAVASGNVVVTGGYPNTWQSITLNKKSGNLGKPGDTVITFATNNPSGGHNVSIVGYDDELTVTANGITTKGAFLIANSWGRSYGRNGYAWITYDALNSVSDYEEFVLPENLAKEGLERDWPFDQFCFLYWDSDLLFETPALYAEIKVSVANRDAFGVELSRTDSNGQSETFSPSIFAFRDMHIKYEADGYLNPAGIINGPAADFGFAVNLELLLRGLPEGADYEDYLFGIDVRSFDDSAQLVLKSITLKNAAGETLRALSFGEGKALAGGSGENFVFSFSEELKESFLDGSYIFRSAADGGYIAKSGVVGLASGKEKDAMKFTVELDPETGLYVLSRADGFVLEFKDGIKDGSEAVFNKQQFARAGIQTMHISYVEGGGVCFFAVDENGVNYALCFDGGKLKLARADALEERFCFEVLATKTVYGDTGVTVGDVLKVCGTTNVKVSEARLALLSADGTVLAEQTAAVTSRAYTGSFDLPQEAGVYYIEVTDETGKPIGNALVFEVKGA